MASGVYVRSTEFVGTGGARRKLTHQHLLMLDDTQSALGITQSSVVGRRIQTTWIVGNPSKLGHVFLIGLKVTNSSSKHLAL